MAKSSYNAGLRDQIISALDIQAEYAAMGVIFAADEPRASGKISCYGFNREVPGANSPSGWVDTVTGLYGDSGAGEKAMSIFDFAVQKAGICADYASALKYFAERAGVELSSATAGRKRKPKVDPSIELKFQTWDLGNCRLARQWCMIHKPGTSLRAIIRAGGKMAHWKSHIDPKTGEHKNGGHKVIALPCYGEKLTAAPPVAWQIYDIYGGSLTKSSKRGAPISIGGTSGTLMNLEAVRQLAATPPNDEQVVWKTAGPSDMLALIAAIPPKLRRLHLAVTNASGEGGAVPRWLADFFFGRRLHIVHDRDDTGLKGELIWFNATYDKAKEVAVFRLPFDLQKNKGLDLRDFILRQVTNVQAG